MFPSVQCSLSGVKGSQVSLATAGAMIEDEDPSLLIIQNILAAEHPGRKTVCLSALTV